MRLPADDEKAIRDLMFQESQLPYGHPSRHTGMPYAFALGSFMIWAAKQWRPASTSTRPAPATGNTARRRPRGNTKRRQLVKRKRSKKGKR